MDNRLHMEDENLNKLCTLESTSKNDSERIVQNITLEEPTSSEHTCRMNNDRSCDMEDNILEDSITLVSGSMSVGEQIRSLDSGQITEKPMASECLSQSNLNEIAELSDHTMQREPDKQGEFDTTQKDIPIIDNKVTIEDNISPAKDPNYNDSVSAVSDVDYSEIRCNANETNESLNSDIKASNCDLQLDIEIAQPNLVSKDISENSDDAVRDAPCEVKLVESKAQDKTNDAILLTKERRNDEHGDEEFVLKDFIATKDDQEKPIEPSTNKEDNMDRICNAGETCSKDHNDLTTIVASDKIADAADTFQRVEVGPVVSTVEETQLLLPADEHVPNDGKMADSIIPTHVEIDDDTCKDRSEILKQCSSRKISAQTKTISFESDNDPQPIAAKAQATDLQCSGLTSTRQTVDDNHLFTKSSFIRKQKRYRSESDAELSKADTQNLKDDSRENEEGQNDTPLINIPGNLSAYKIAIPAAAGLVGGALLGPAGLVLAAKAASVVAFGGAVGYTGAKVIEKQEKDAAKQSENIIMNATEPRQNIVIMPATDLNSTPATASISESCTAAVCDAKVSTGEKEAMKVESGDQSILHKMGNCVPGLSVDDDKSKEIKQEQVTSKPKDDEDEEASTILTQNDAQNNGHQNEAEPLLTPNVTSNTEQANDNEHSQNVEKHLEETVSESTAELNLTENQDGETEAQSKGFLGGYKAALYPAAGATLGAALGGPLGLAFGAKLGSAAAISGTLTGYTWGVIKGHAKDTAEREDIRSRTSSECESMDNDINNAREKQLQPSEPVSQESQDHKEEKPNQLEKKPTTLQRLLPNETKEHIVSDVKTFFSSMKTGFFDFISEPEIPESDDDTNEKEQSGVTVEDSQDIVRETKEKPIDNGNSMQVNQLPVIEKPKLKIVPTSSLPVVEYSDLPCDNQTAADSKTCEEMEETTCDPPDETVAHDTEACTVPVNCDLLEQATKETEINNEGNEGDETDANKCTDGCKNFELQYHEDQHNETLLEAEARPEYQKDTGHQERSCQTDGNADVAENEEVGGEQSTSTLSKAGMLPMAGAVAGTIMGGPIGLAVGLKVGSILAVGTGIGGYIGGKIIEEERQLGTPVPTETPPAVKQLL